MQQDSLYHKLCLFLADRHLLPQHEEHGECDTDPHELRDAEVRYRWLGNRCERFQAGDNIGEGSQ